MHAYEENNWLSCSKFILSGRHYLQYSHQVIAFCIACFCPWDWATCKYIEKSIRPLHNCACPELIIFTTVVHLYLLGMKTTLPSRVTLPAHRCPPWRRQRMLMRSKCAWPECDSGQVVTARPSCFLFLLASVVGTTGPSCPTQLPTLVPDIREPSSLRWHFLVVADF